jgi:hypothetical protein
MTNGCRVSKNVAMQVERVDRNALRASWGQAAPPRDKTLNTELPTPATWNLLLGTFPAVNHAGFVTILSHASDTQRSQKSHTIDGVLRQSWGIFLYGAGCCLPDRSFGRSRHIPFQTILTS